MNTLTKTNNQRSMTRPWLRDFLDMENLFDGGNWLKPLQRSAPAVNVSENDKNFLVDVVAPRFKKDDFKVSINDDMLTISAEAKNTSTDEDIEYNRREYSYSSFTRSFCLPDNASKDKIDANYLDGILKLTIPKTENSAKPARTIPIK
jgi:HSP20 family protein